MKRRYQFFFDSGLIEVVETRQPFLRLLYESNATVLIRFLTYSSRRDLRIQWRKPDVDRQPLR